MLFGNTTQPATGSGIFGSTNPPQQPQTTGGGVFGNATSTSLFGGNAQPAAMTGGNIFGSTVTQPATSGSIFGGTSQPTNPQQQPSAGGLFGASNATTQPAANLFGSTATTTPAQGSGLFGTSTSSSNPLFGNKPPSSIFGAPTTGTTTGTSTISPPTLFGQPAAQTSTSTAQPTTSLFGVPTQPQQPQKPSGSLFASTTQPSTTGTLFGSTLAPPTLGPGLGTGSILGTSTSRSSQSTLGATQQQDPQSQFVALTQRIDAIAEAWNPNSPLCRFQVSITCDAISAGRQLIPTIPSTISIT